MANNVGNLPAVSGDNVHLDRAVNQHLHEAEITAHSEEYIMTLCQKVRPLAIVRISWAHIPYYATTPLVIHMRVQIAVYAT